MCKSCDIEFEQTNSLERLKQDNYEILMSCHEFVNPDDIPSRIKIIMGPQFFVFPEDPHQEIVKPFNPLYAERCVFNVLCTWVRNVILEFVNNDGFLVPMKELPFGINTEKFKPEKEEEKIYDCIVYKKRRMHDIYNHSISTLEQLNLKYIVFEYGRYDERDYLRALSKCKFMLVLDSTESQGFALQEAMSCNVPLLVMDASSMYDETSDGRTENYYKYREKSKKLLGTSVPYWSDEHCGIKISRKEELKESIERMVKDYILYSPRTFILENLSEKVCMERILDYFKLEKN